MLDPGRQDDRETRQTHVAKMRREKQVAVIFPRTRMNDWSKLAVLFPRTRMNNWSKLFSTQGFQEKNPFTQAKLLNCYWSKSALRHILTPTNQSQTCRPHIITQSCGNHVKTTLFVIDNNCFVSGFPRKQSACPRRVPKPAFQENNPRAHAASPSEAHPQNILRLVNASIMSSESNTN